jgi:polyhydroxybutyrate depolymerase
MQFTPQADRRGFLYAAPNGTYDSTGNRFWNATPACCNFYGSQVDDELYLVNVIKAVSAKYTVDAHRVFLIGHSNGAFMAYRMACDHADIVAGVAALNGAMTDDMSTCHPQRPVSVLTIRGTADDAIVNSGGLFRGHPYPSTQATVGDWVRLDGCGATADASAPLVDMDTDIQGPETAISRYPACHDNTKVELWQIQGGSHVPHFTGAFAPDVINFLLGPPAK